MKWQVMVLLCCAWMNGVALGDTENSQKVEQGGTAAANTGSGNMTVYNNHYGISEEAFAKKAVDLGVTDAALANFFKILEQEKVAPADLDKKLREITGSYKKLLEGSDDPEVNTLLRQARESIEGKNAQGNSVTIDFAKAEALLQQAELRELQHFEELQQEELQQIEALQQRIQTLQEIEEQAESALQQRKLGRRIEQLQQIKKQAIATLSEKRASVQESVMGILTRLNADSADSDEKLHSDEELHETAKSYKKLLEGSDDPEVNTLLRQARESIEGKDAQGNSVTIDFAKAEVLLQQAMLREQQHIRELQQIEKQARIEIEIEYKSSAESQSMKWILPQLGELVDTQFYELLQIEEQAKAAWENKQVSVALILVQLGDLADTQLKYDEANSYYQLASDRLKTRSWEISSTMSYQSISMPKSFSYPRSLSPVPSAPKSFSYPSSSSHAPMNPCYQNQTPGVCDPVSGCGCTQK